MATKKATFAEAEITVKKKLQLLSEIQRTDSEIDEIERIKGELPEEIKNAEDTIEGLKTRVETINADIDELNRQIQANKSDNERLKESIKKHENDKDRIRNDRDLIALENEIEADNLDISINDKHNKAFNAQIKEKKKLVEETLDEIEGREKDLDLKKEELNVIENEKADEVTALEKKRDTLREEFPDKRLLDAYTRIRKNVRNGLAVVPVIREACGGCFNHIPPQRRIDIIEAKKLIVCEYCGRILVSESVEEECENAKATEPAAKPKATKKATTKKK